jgi:hypothetical protein
MTGRAWSMHDPNASVVTRWSVEEELEKVSGCRAPAVQSGANDEHTIAKARAARARTTRGGGRAAAAAGGSRSGTHAHGCIRQVQQLSGGR